MNKELIEILESFKRVGGILRTGQQIRLVIALFLMIIVGALANIPAVAVGKLLDHFIEVNKIQFMDAWPFLAIIFISILVREAIQVGRKFLVENTCTRVDKDVRVSLVSHLLQVDLAFFAGKQVGLLHGRINRSIEGLVKLLKLCFLDFLPSLFIAGFALGVAFYRAPIILGSCMALVIPFGFWIVLRQVASQKGIRINLLRGKDEIDGIVVELLGGLENVRAMNTESFETNRVEQVAERLRAKEMVHHIWMAGYDAAKYINEGLFHVLVLAVSIWLATTGGISTGDILTYSLLFIGVVTPLREIHRIFDEAHEASIRVHDFFDLMDLSVDRSFGVIPADFEKKSTVMKEPPAVKISDMHFYYPGMCNPAINQLNLEIRSGEFLGICGPAGCGKSTVLKILMRLIHADEGEVLLFGRDINAVTRKELACMVGYVSQNPFLVSGTVFENIAYGLSNVAYEEVQEAASKANIHQEIMTFTAGYETQVGERGTNLSGGQRQRLALARIFLRSPSLIILDEATSALDNLNEIAIQRALEQVMKKATIIAVAHRLTTLRNADRILVFEKGKIVESGTYNELLISGGLFAALAQATMSKWDKALQTKTDPDLVIFNQLHAIFKKPHFPKAIGIGH